MKAVSAMYLQVRWFQWKDFFVALSLKFKISLLEERTFSLRLSLKKISIQHFMNFEA